MSVTYGFYDSLNHDRTYSTLQFSSIFDGIISDGIYATYLDAMEVAATDPISMNVNVKPGRAWFNHTWTLNDAVLVLAVDTPDVALPRIDTVVLEVASGVNDRANRIFLKKGTPASTPAAPSLINGDGGVYQYALANVRVAKQADVTTNGGIRAQDITNRRGTSGTPFVTGLINTININTLITQWSAEFNELFAELEEQISQAASQTLIDGSVTYDKLAPSLKEQLGGALYFKTVAVSAGTGDIATVSNAKITSDHVLANITWANSSVITADVSWTTSSGGLVLNGTCTSATSCDIVLVKKNN